MRKSVCGRVVFCLLSVPVAISHKQIEIYDVISGGAGHYMHGTNEQRTLSCSAKYTRIVAKINWKEMVWRVYAA